MDSNTFWVLCGTTLLGLCSGVIGSFAFLRKRGLMGDVLAHAALPGICLAFLITGSKNPFLFLIGAAITGLLASLCISWITRYSRIKEDAALGLVLSVFFGIGIVLLTQIQHSENGNQSGLDQFLFGQAASMLGSDVQVMGFVAASLLILCFLFFKEFKLLCFDMNFGQSLGFGMRKIEFLLMLFLVMAVVIGLQVAGVVLMAALLITPAAAARYWTERLDYMIIIAAIMGASSGVIGTWISASGYHLSTGPLIVLVATSLFLFSMIFAPKRGMLAKWMRLWKTKKQIEQEDFLVAIYEVVEHKGDEHQSVYWHELQKDYPVSKRTLLQLEKMNIVKISRMNSQLLIKLTDQGWTRMYDTVLTKRMLEMWRMYEGVLTNQLPNNDLVTREQIPEDLASELYKLLIQHNHEPKLIPQSHVMLERGTSL